MSAVLASPLYREPVEFRAVEAPGPLAISDRGDGLYVVANDTANHVEFRGFFGSYGPGVFANAPELLEVVNAMLNDIGRDNSMPSAVKARAVLAKVGAAS